MNNTLIIVPTYNKRENTERLIHTIQSMVKDVEILVVDDNSSDGTSDTVDHIMQTVSGVHLITRKKKKELETAYLAEFQFAIECSVEYIVTMDADFSHDPKYITQLLDQGKRYDIVIALRHIENSGTKAWPFQRRLLSVVGNQYIRLITRLPIKDCTSGFKCYCVAALQGINLTTIKVHHFVFQIEIVYKLFKKECTLIELPYIFEKRIKENSKISMEVLLEAL